MAGGGLGTIDLWTAANLVANVRLRAMRPLTNDLSFSDANILTLANQEMSGFMVPFIRNMNEEYMIKSVTIPLVSGTAAYNIPSRSVFNTLRDIVLLDPQGNSTSLAMYQPELAVNYNNSYNNSTSPRGCYVQDNQIVLVPTPNSTSYSLKLTFQVRPNTIVLPFSVTALNQIAQVTAVNTSTGVLTLDGSSSFSTNTTFDIVSRDSPYNTRVFDVTATSVSGSASITFPAATVSNVQVNDWVCVAETSPAPQLPYELQSMFNQRVAVKLLELVGDSNMNIAMQTLAQMETTFRQSMAPRIDGESIKLVNRNIVTGTGYVRWGG